MEMDLEPRDIIAKLNWRLLLVHFIACFLFIYGSKLFGILHDLDIVAVYEKYKKINSIDASRIAVDAVWVATAQLLGLLSAYLISLLISIKYKWSRVNSLVILVISYFLWRAGFFGWAQLSFIFLAPGSFFKDDVIWYYLINGSVMLGLGLMLFYSKWTIQFIDRNAPKTVEGVLE
jgi:hypothetical protein